MKNILFVLFSAVFLIGCGSSVPNVETPARQTQVKTRPSVSKTVLGNNVPQDTKKVTNTAHENFDVDAFFKSFIEKAQLGKKDEAFSLYASLPDASKKKINKELSLEEEVVFADFESMISAVQAAIIASLQQAPSPLGHNIQEAQNHAIVISSCDFRIQGSTLKCGFVNQGEALSLVFKGITELDIKGNPKREDIESGGRTITATSYLDTYKDQCKSPIISGTFERQEIVEGQTIIPSGKYFTVLFDCSDSPDDRVVEDNPFKAKISFGYERAGIESEFSSFASGTVD